jgi:hypothetical protein
MEKNVERTGLEVAASGAEIRNQDLPTMKLELKSHALP